MKTIFTLTVLFLSALIQQSFAQNMLPDSVYIKETFGTGTTKTALPAGRATYSYNGSTSLNDGDYMVFNKTNGRPEWHNAPDHTGDANGKMMVINAGLSASEFYRDTVYNLVGGVSYSTYLYIMNVNTLGTCGATAILPKLQFIVEYYNTLTASYTQLTTFTTAFIPQSATPTWVLAGGTFVLPANVNTVRYRIINNSNGGCGNDLAIDDITFARATNLPIMPVTGFQAAAQFNGNNISVLWETASETNTKNFIVEKSKDGVNWSDMDTVDAAGFSQTKRNYTSIDAMPAAINYYRVKQFDMNGRFTYSNVTSLAVKNNSVVAKTFPNPFVNQLQVDINSNGNQKITINIADASGRKLIQKAWQISKGSNSFSIPEVKQLVTGMYFIDIRNEDGISLYKSTILKN
jgi:hypothetical protein